jgi:hypothetical protein
MQLPVNPQEGEMTPQHTAASSVEDALSYLPEHLRITLALLRSADDDLAELTLAALPLGSRLTLDQLGLIDKARPREPDAPLVVHITDLGREVMTACALEGVPSEVSRSLAALEEARARRARSEIEAQA